VYDLRLRLRSMDSDRSSARSGGGHKACRVAHGPERQRLIGLAMAWLELAGRDLSRGDGASLLIERCVLGACLRSLCSIGDESDSRWVDEQVFSALED
jgi:hypothetical protein